MLNLPQTPKWDIARVSHSTLVNADCFDIFHLIADKSVDAIIADLPYGTTQNKWDSVLPLDELWKQYKRILKDNGLAVLFASQPFTSALIMSNTKEYKYNWVWDKVNKFSGHLNAKKQPLRITEDICIFYSQQPTYNPIMVKGEPYKATSKGGKSSSFGKQTDGVTTINEGWYYPKNIISIKGDERGTEGRIHPTQKPVELMEYLIKTYTNENEIVLDNAMGSGTTGLACLKTNRQFIGIEKEKQYYDVAVQRLSSYCG